MAETLDVFWHEDVLLHDTGRGVFERAASPLLAEQEPHPENALRLRNMKAILERGPLREHVRWRAGRRAEPGELELVHEAAYVEAEGGYAPAYAAFCLHATLEGVLDLSLSLPDPLAYLPEDPTAARAAVAACRDFLAPYWSIPEGDSARSYGGGL